MNPTPGMSEESARDTVKRHEFDTGQRPKPDLRDYDYAKGYLAGLEQGRDRIVEIHVDHGEFELAKANEASIRRDLVKVEAALESSRQEIERLKEEYSKNLIESSKDLLNAVEGSRKMGMELESSRQEIERLKVKLELQIVDQSVVDGACRRLKEELEAERQSTRELIEALGALEYPDGVIRGPMTDGPELDELNRVLSRHKAGGKSE